MRVMPSVLLTLVLAVVLTGCSQESPTRPASEPDSVVFDAKGGNGNGNGGGNGGGGGGGGGAVPATFDVTFDGDLRTLATGLAASVKDSDNRLHLSDFPMDDISFLKNHPGIAGSETCFADTQIGVDENIEILFSAPKRKPGFLGFNYWFDGLSQEGNPTLYRLVMDGAFTGGTEADWVGDATAEFTAWSINGQVEVNGDTPCTGEGVTSTTVVIDQVE